MAESLWAAGGIPTTPGTGKILPIPSSILHGVFRKHALHDIRFEQSIQDSTTYAEVGFSSTQFKQIRSDIDSRFREAHDSPRCRHSHTLASVARSRGQMVLVGLPWSGPAKTPPPRLLTVW